MSVRRLADVAVQPQQFAFSDSNAAWAQTTIRKYPEGRQQSAVIPLLMRAQEQDGWVTKAAIESIADMLDMPYIRVLEVATFYTQFQLKPIGTRAHIQVCGTTPCMLRGSEELIALCKRKIHGQPLTQNESGTLSWEEVECQGACVNAPMVMIFKDSYEDLTVERLEEIIDTFEAGRGAEIVPGPQIDRIFSAPIDGLTTLTEEPTPQRNQVTEPPAPPAPQEGASVPPSEAGRPKSTDAETNPTMKTPATAKSESAANAKKEGGETKDAASVDTPEGGEKTDLTAGAGKPAPEAK
ncbi:NADH dehydrogenase subunit E [Rhizobium sp. PP-F2F-G38]|uniref:NADH-quinone oxidoreductase subunit NuoE n=1 Tax=Rhizobium sp. PP-CC-3G-465 TaxID=2135648 RepID=UPI000D81A3E3|nr:NADH dehydrogenase subunit E [Rhizobium sp. PP-WC-1G-195]PYE99182.1 NADH dehydrogenase subunit E [Rhizobium sp. PP-F2F-G38]TCL96905.1 NADH dehydrogenase subunit E [Rhizobium sp. PP-WC-2G-219]TCP87214.1 NADH dehydrogenase subunit E [Rhizobium sp. PP-CC-2G-626]TCQ12642.1 NADH dehydrogenase subunit E [Rhizobium sp. PP-F2F-G36]TCQ28611.1 NADH dehydrogenase subunit E [Rhizobium sp. PP-CC-3G-465]